MKKLLLSIAALTALVLIPNQGLAATSSDELVNYTIHPNSITFYLDDVPFEEGDEYIVSCSTSSGAIGSTSVTARGTKPELNITGLKPSSSYSCKAKTVRYIDNGGINKAKIVGYESGEMIITTGETLRILEFSQGSDSLKVRVNEIEKSDNEVYFLECNLTHGPQYSIPHAKSDTPTIKIENLDWFSEYTCHAGVGVDDGQKRLSNISQTSENLVTFTTEGKQEVSPSREIEFNEEVVEDWGDYTRPFPDIYFDNIWGKAASELYRRGIIHGYPDGEFKGAQNVNRAEAAKFLLLARYTDIPDYQNNYQFPDVLSGKWYTQYIIMASSKDIIHGYQDGLFRPNNTVNTAEFIKMIVRTFDLPQNLSYSYQDVDPNQWYAKYAGAAEKINLFPDRKDNLFPHQNLSRYEVAVAIYQVLQYLESQQ